MKKKNPTYPPQPVQACGTKLIRLQNNYNTKAASYSTAVYEIANSKYSGVNPAAQYGSHAKMHSAAKGFLLGKYGSGKPFSHNKAWTVYTLGKCLFHGTLGEFENWFEQLGHCAVEEIDDIE